MFILTLARIWKLIIRGIRGEKFSDEIKILLSALFDLIRYIFKPQRRNPRVYFDLRAKIRMPKNISIKFKVRAGSDDLYLFLPGREGDVEEFIFSNLKEGDIFIDCGASVGYYTISASKLVGKSGKVVSFEANPLSYEILEENVSLNDCDNVILINRAVYDKGGLELGLDFKEGFYGEGKIVSEGKIKVISTTIDDTLKSLSIDKVKILKLDIEGSEYKALLGARNTLKMTEFVILECSENMESIKKFLRENGFITEKLKFTTYILAKRTV